MGFPFSKGLKPPTSDMFRQLPCFSNNPDAPHMGLDSLRFETTTFKKFLYGLSSARLW